MSREGEGDLVPEEQTMGGSVGFGGVIIRFGSP